MTLIDQLLEPLRGPEPTKEQLNAWNINRWLWLAHDYSDILKQLKPYLTRITAKEMHGLYEDLRYSEKYDDVIIKAFLFDKLYNKNT